MLASRYSFKIVSILVTSFFALSLQGSIIVMRHGESTHNVQEFYNSNPNHSNYRPSFLTQDGIHDLKESCKKLLALGVTKENVTVAYVSPLPRTIQTAAILIQMGVVAPDKIKIDQRLIEVQMGDREGKHYHDFPGDPWDLSPAVAAGYHGESFDDARKRIVDLFQQIKKENHTGNIIFITHGGPALQLVAFALGQDNIQLPPAAFKIIE